MSRRFDLILKVQLKVQNLMLHILLFLSFIKMFDARERERESIEIFVEKAAVPLHFLSLG